jgi:predicted nucleotidyltransferase
VELERLTFDDYTGLLLFLDRLFGRQVEAVLIQDLRPQWKDDILAEAVYAKGI